MRTLSALPLLLTSCSVSAFRHVPTAHRPASRNAALSPLMKAPKDDKKVEALTNPLKVIATVIAQAEIVGVEGVRVTKLPKDASSKPESATVLSKEAKRAPKWDNIWEIDDVEEQEPRLPNGARREVDRTNVHPLLKLGDRPIAEPVLTALLALPTPLLLTLASPLLLVLAPFIAMVVAERKVQWEAEVAASKDEHKAAFAANWQACREEQSKNVRKLLDARLTGARDPLLPPTDREWTVAVTMATGQEGRAIVKALSAATESFPNLRVRALVRTPSSPKALELGSLPRVQIVQADSVDESSLASALEGVDAAYLCTTLNNAAAGTWAMEWDGGRYEIEQGIAFAAAAARVPSLQQVVYGTAPSRKWPVGYRVEPPIHYAAKWRIEEILTEAGLPLTTLRKCPYHENFTKLTKPVPRRDGQGPRPPGSPAAADGAEAGAAAGSAWWEPGTYNIKALSDGKFQYNMLGPGDIGAWALLAFSHPSVLRGTSLSIAADCLTGPEMAEVATEAKAFGPAVGFAYKEQPRWLFEALAFVEPTFVYISGLQRWNSDGGKYDLTKEDVEELRALHKGTTWSEHLQSDGLEQFTATMADLLPDAIKQS